MQTKTLERKKKTYHQDNMTMSIHVKNNLPSMCAIFLFCTENITYFKSADIYVFKCEKKVKFKTLAKSWASNFTIRDFVYLLENNGIISNDTNIVIDNQIFLSSLNKWFFNKFSSSPQYDDKNIRIFESNTTQVFDNGNLIIDLSWARDIHDVVKFVHGYYVTNVDLDWKIVCAYIMYNIKCSLGFFIYTIFIYTAILYIFLHITSD